MITSSIVKITFCSAVRYLQDYRLCRSNLVKMEKSEKVPELKVFSSTNKSVKLKSLQLFSPEVTVNQIFHANPHHDRFIPTGCMDADYFCQKSLCRVAQPNQGFRSQLAAAAQHKELMQHRVGDTRGECSCWDCGLNQCEATEPTKRDTTR